MLKKCVYITRSFVLGVIFYLSLCNGLKSMSRWRMSCRARAARACAPFRFELTGCMQLNERSCRAPTEVHRTYSSSSKQIMYGAHCKVCAGEIYNSMQYWLSLSGTREWERQLRQPASHVNIAGCIRCKPILDRSLIGVLRRASAFVFGFFDLVASTLFAPKASELIWPLCTITVNSYISIFNQLFL